MKYSTLAAFEKHLEGASPKHFADIYLILAKEPFARKQAVDRLVAIVLKNEPSPELSLQVFDAEKHNVSIILQELETLAFFSKKRVVVIHEVDAFDKAATTKLEGYFTSPNRAVCLVMTTASLNRSTTFYKKTEKVGVLLDIPEEKSWEREKSVAEWLRIEAAANGKQIDPATCQLLVKQLGTDQMLLQGELQKLICYVGERTVVDTRDVAAICTSINLDNAWQLGEALFRRDVSAALQIGKALIADGVALIALLRQIRSQFQTEYQICSILNNGGNASNIAQDYPYMRGTVLERHVRQAQSYGMARFKSGMLAIDATELQAKNSATDPDFLVEKLIIKLTT